MVLLKFWPGQKQFNIEIDGTTISNSKYTIFLGVYVDDYLTLEEHTNILYTKLLNNKRLLLNAKSLLPISCLLKVYYAHVYVMHQQDCLLLSQLHPTFPPVWME